MQRLVVWRSPSSLPCFSLMNIIERSQLIDQLNWRYATKQYDRGRRITPSDWETLEQALVLTPSGFGLQPWRFLVIDDPKVRAELLLASYGQPQVVDASHLVVFAAKTSFSAADVDLHLQRVSEVTGAPLNSLSGYRTAMVRSIIEGLTDAERKAWATNQTYIALGNLITSAALLGIDASPMEGFERNRYDDILGLRPRGLSSVVIAALGYRAESDKYAAAPKVRFPINEMVVHV